MKAQIGHRVEWHIVNGGTDQGWLIGVDRLLTFENPMATVELDGGRRVLVPAWTLRAVCTSDDPADHQGDTCPVHEA